MSGIRCQEGIRVLADSAFKLEAEPEDLEIILFSDNETIDKDTVDADLDEVVTNGGEKVTLVKANFAAATDADPSVSRYNGATGVVFDITGALTIYGPDCCETAAVRAFLFTGKERRNDHGRSQMSRRYSSARGFGVQA